MVMIRALAPAFRTKRLLAQRVNERHLDQLVRFDADPEVRQWLGGVGTDEETREWLAERVEPHWEQYGYGVYALFEKEAECDASGGRELVGRAGLERAAADVAEAIGEPKAVELLYAIAPAYWGRGYATEIARTLTGLALGPLDLESVVAYTLPENAASRRVMEKVGFEYERDLVHEGLPHVLYRRAPRGETE